MSIAPRETKCLSSCHGAPGTARFGHFVNTPPSGLTVGVPQNGHFAGGSGGVGAALRSTACGAGETHLRDHVAGAQHDHLVADAHVLAREVLLVVQRRELDGHAADVDRLEHGERVQVAELADVPHDVLPAA